MSETQIHNSMEEELKRAIIRKHQINNGNITTDDTLIEASFCLAVNNLTLIKNRFGSDVQAGTHLDDNDMEYFLSGANKAMIKMFKKSYNETHYSMILERYHSIVSNIRAKELINHHYDDLYGSEGGDVI